MSKESKDTSLSSLKGLIEMYLSSQLLFQEIFTPLKKTMKDSEINSLLSEKSGKGLNSIYRDKNTGVVFSAVMFLRYWKAFLEIHQERGLDKNTLPNLEDLTAKYKQSIDAISFVEDAENLESAIHTYFPLIVEIVLFYEKHPLSSEKLSKREVLETLKERKDIQDALRTERARRMTKVD
ncbi:hypothetical protein ACSHUI_17430 [Bacillus subtilis]|uniref:hypothetical protein n=1 Tax=Bacillus subtilis TaxID=1423 RepID=UPI0007E51A19|nr:hypothetical protein [Bacillus subtilis]MCY9354613.1 hypothetical protein [Bacillus spizizenii]OAY86693.1 hypothetical protein AWM78_16210 [Bacillus subtilis subsp. subtilis]GLI89745.1 hypothetical protein ANABIO4_30970 [Bacillus subtilis]